MGVQLRTTMLVTSAIALFGCGESFTTGAGPGGGSGEAAGSGGVGNSSTFGGGGTGGDGAGGAGGSPCTEPDDDGDGFSECAGDCDDADPSINPGALEVCGDGVDQDCDGKSDAEPPCSGIGTFVSQKKGNVGATGTASDPVATITEGIARATQIGVPTAVIVAAGDYTEAIAIEGDISLVGGYDPESWAVRDPDVHLTTLKSTSYDGLRISKAESSVLVDGFTIQGRNVQEGTEDSAAVTIDGSSVILSHDIIVAGSVGVGPGASIGVRVVTWTSLYGAVKLSDNFITAGPAVFGPTYGVFVDAETVDVDLVANKITARAGADSVALHVVNAGVINVTGKNTFQSGAATGNNVPSSSLGVWVQRGSLLFDANLVNPNQVQDPPDCITPDAWCGGIRVSAPGAVITNNIIAGSASSRSAAVHLLQQDGSLETVRVSSNLILASGHGGPGNESTAVLLGAPAMDGGAAAIGIFRNNIFFGGVAQDNYGFYEQQTPGETCGPLELDHNLFHFPIQAPNKGVLYVDWSGAAAMDITAPEDLPGQGKNLVADPQLQNNHLMASSPCRNAGTDKDSPKNDRDQDERPQEGAFDIGPDELVPPG